MNITPTEEQAAAWAKGESITPTEEQAAEWAKCESITPEPPRPKEWEPKNYLFWTTHVTVAANEGPTRFNAKVAKVKAYVKLLAYVEEFGGGWVADWSDAEQFKSTVYFSHEDGEWYTSMATIYRYPNTVFMSIDCCRGLVNKLNSGEVVL